MNTRKTVNPSGEKKTGKKRWIGIWSASYPYLAYFGIDLAVSLLYLLVIFVVTLIMILLGDRDFSKIGLLVGQASSRDAMLRLVLVNIFVLRMAGFIFDVDRERFHQTRVKEFRFKDWSLFLLMGLSIPVLIAAAVRYFDLLPYFPEALLRPNYPEPFSTGLMLIAYGYFVPVAGEILMRGVVLDRLRRRIPALPAVICVAVLSGLLERNLLLGIGSGFLALITGWLFVKYNSLLPCLILRLLFSGGLLIAVTDPGIRLDVETAIPAALLVFAGATVLLWLRKFSPEPYYTDHEAADPVA